jgi:drug/metabolite transporter (DMT)-like permease
MLSLHVAVFLFGLAGLFGKFLTCPADTIVWGRTFFATISLSLLLVYRGRAVPAIGRGEALRLALMGVILAVHWETFFYSIQISSVAVGLLSYSTFPVFVTLIEPVLQNERPRRDDLVTAAVVFLGLVLVVPNLSWADNAFRGACWGVVSGATFAALTLLNRTVSTTQSPVVLALAQNSVACLVLTPFAVTSVPTLVLRDWLLLAVLGALCTATAHSLFIHALRAVRAQVASIIAALEPVYGIVLGALMLGEIPTAREVAGGAIILAVTLRVTLKSRGGDG